MPAAPVRLVVVAEPAASAEDALDRVFAALSDPVRRAILAHLESGDLLVSQVAQRFDISLQAVSKHIQVLVRAGLVAQERTGRINRCSKYWQQQFDVMAVALDDMERRCAQSRGAPRRRPPRRRKRGGSV